jgi:hypothetical protein
LAFTRAISIPAHLKVVVMIRPFRFRSAVPAMLLLGFALSGCAGSNPADPTPSPTPIPIPNATPTPNPEPTPTPQPTPTPCTYGLCEAPTSNTNPVASVILRLYTVRDVFNRWISNWDPGQPIPVGYTAHIDVTGKDGSFKDTLGDRGVQIEFFYSDPSLIQESGNHPWQRKLLVKKAGLLEVRVVFDGVRSDTLQLYFRD